MMEWAKDAQRVKWVKDTQRIKWAEEAQSIECIGLARMLGSKDQKNE